MLEKEREKKSIFLEIYDDLDTGLVHYVHSEFELLISVVLVFIVKE